MIGKSMSLRVLPSSCFALALAFPAYVFAASTCSCNHDSTDGAGRRHICATEQTCSDGETAKCTCDSSGCSGSCSKSGVGVFPGGRIGKTQLGGIAPVVDSLAISFDSVNFKGLTEHFAGLGWAVNVEGAKPADDALLNIATDEADLSEIVQLIADQLDRQVRVDYDSRTIIFSDNGAGSSLATVNVE